MSKCFYNLLRKWSSQISSLLGCSWHLKLGALGELVSSHRRGREKRLKGPFYMKYTCKPFQLSVLQPNGPKASDYLKCGLAECFHIQRLLERLDATDLEWRRNHGSLWTSSEVLPWTGLRRSLMLHLHTVYELSAQSFPLHFGSPAWRLLLETRFIAALQTFIG